MRVVFGLVVWLVGVIVVHPRPFDLAWGYALLLLSPLVLVPIGLELAGDGRLLRWARRIQFPAALLLGVAYFQPQGILAAALALPWLVTTSFVALAGLGRIIGRGLSPLSALCSDAGLVYLVVGGAWVVSDRFGYQPLGFDPVIVLLTGIHFHYAGFALPLMTGWAMRHVPGRLATIAGMGVIAGVPLVAVGITATRLGASPAIEMAAVGWMMAAGLLSAWLHLRLALNSAWPTRVRILWAVAAVSLGASMLLAGLYGTRFVVPMTWLDIPFMRAFHGTANALGFAAAGLVAWRRAMSIEREP